ncbi:hypothetical protein SteCoe_25793 [Stentor coeruleus]|uniref:DUF4378 domain-containing protein n=1 Tax=Stentor coeruleus TaxID=5963 RepID=A0A1R2BEF7_9CILI|nr:hypothetical protein SteCoe_25793 [Stentor coeruleus]
MIKIKSGKVLAKKSHSRTPSLKKIRKVVPKPFIISPDILITTPDRSPSTKVGGKTSKKPSNKKDQEDIKKSYRENKETWFRPIDEPKIIKEDKSPRPVYKISKSAMGVRKEHKIKKPKKEQIPILKTEERIVIKKKIKKRDRSTGHGNFQKLKHRDYEIKDEENRIRKKSKEKRMKNEAKKIHVKGIELFANKTIEKKVKQKGKKKDMKISYKPGWIEPSFASNLKNKDSYSRHYDLNMFSSENFSSYDVSGLNADISHPPQALGLRKHASCQINHSQKASITNNMLSSSLQTGDTKYAYRPKKHKKIRIVKLSGRKQKRKKMSPNKAATKIQAVVRGFLTRNQIQKQNKSDDYSNTGILNLDLKNLNSEFDEVQYITGDLQKNQENFDSKDHEIEFSHETFTFQGKSKDKSPKVRSNPEESKGKLRILLTKGKNDPNHANFKENTDSKNSPIVVEKNHSEIVFQNLSEKNKESEERVKKKQGLSKSERKPLPKSNDFMNRWQDSYVGGKDLELPKSEIHVKKSFLEEYLESSPDVNDISFKFHEKTPAPKINLNDLRSPRPGKINPTHIEKSPKIHNLYDIEQILSPKASDTSTKPLSIPIKSDLYKFVPKTSDQKVPESSSLKRFNEKRQDISPLTKEIVKKNHESSSRRSSIEKNAEPTSKNPISYPDESSPQKKHQEPLKNSFQNSSEKIEPENSPKTLSPIEKGSYIGIKEMSKRLEEEKKNYELAEKNQKDLENYILLDSLMSKNTPDINELRKKDLETIQHLTGRTGSELEIFEIFQNIINRRYEKINSMFNENIKAVQDALAQSVISEESSSIFIENMNNNENINFKDQGKNSKIEENCKVRRLNSSPEPINMFVVFMYHPEKNPIPFIDNEPEKTQIKSMLEYDKKNTILHFAEKLEQIDVKIDEEIPVPHNSSRIVWIDEVAMPSNIDFTDLIIDAAISDIYDDLLNWILEDLWVISSDFIQEFSNELIKAILANEICEQIEDMRKDYSEGQVLIIISKIFDRTQNLIAEELQKPLECDPLGVLSLLQESEVGAGFFPEEKYSMLNFEAFSDVLGCHSKYMQIFNTMVFDCINEILEKMMCKEELPWAVKRNLKAKKIEVEEVQRNIEIELLKYCRIKSGPIIYDEFDGNGHVTEKILIQKRENGILKMLAMEITGNESIWFDYDKEELQAKLDLADMVLEEEIDDIVEILIKT